MFTSNNSEKDLLISRIQDTVELSLIRHKTCYMGFLNEAELYTAEEYLHSINADYCFWGGYDNAQRKILCALYNDFNVSDVPVSAVEFTFRKEDRLSHRDFLGTILSVGLERDTVGDILTDAGRAVVFIKSEIRDYVCSQITKVGGTGVKIKDADLENLPVKNHKEEKFITVSSLRIDAIVAALTGLSREKAQKAVFQGLVSINYSECLSSSFKVSENDVVSIRKHGKFIVKNVIGETRKGRLKLSVQIFK